MHLFCSVPIYGLATKLRNRLTPAILKATVLPTKAAASVRASVRSFHLNHRPNTGDSGDKHVPRPAALGTKAMMGQMRSRVVSRMEHAYMGERVRFRHHMSTIHQNYQNWEQSTFHFHGNSVVGSRFP